MRIATQLPHSMFTMRVYANMPLASGSASRRNNHRRRRQAVALRVSPMKRPRCLEMALLY